MATNRLLLLPESRNRRRRDAYLKKARKRIRYAVGYLDQLIEGGRALSEQERELYARDVEDLLEDARRLVRRGRRAGRG